MDDEKKQKNSMTGKMGDFAKKAIDKKFKKPSQIIKKILIQALLPILLKTIITVLILASIMSAIKSFLNLDESNSSKESYAGATSSSSSIDLPSDGSSSDSGGSASDGNSSGSGGSASDGNPSESGNSSSQKNKYNTYGKIILNVDNLSADGAYEIKYEFKDEQGNVYTEEQAIQKIKQDLISENENLNLSNFSKSELKVIGALMYNGLKVENYNEKELSALVVFFKVDWATQNFDLRPEGSTSKQTIDEIRESDKIYGTLKINKLKIEVDENSKAVHKEENLEYVAYGNEETVGTFLYMIKQNDENVKNKFSINKDGNLVVAKYGISTVKYTYQNEQEKELTDDEMKKIPEENIYENMDYSYINEYPLPIDYKKDIAKYVVDYGFLSDFLTTTRNPEFCLEMAQLGIDSKIVITLKENVEETIIHEKNIYTQSTLLYDYVSYSVSGQVKNLRNEEQMIASKNENPNTSNELDKYGWHSGLPRTQTGEGGRTYIYTWEDENVKYKLKHVSNNVYNNWKLYKIVQIEEQVDIPTVDNGPELINLENNHIKEEYPDYTIDEDYTDKEEFVYTINIDTIRKNSIYDIDISEVDCWFLEYKRRYSTPVVQRDILPIPSTPEPEQYPEEQEIVQETTKDTNIINNDVHVKDFIQVKVNQYKQSHSNADNVQCNVKELTVKKRQKTDKQIKQYTGIVTKYQFGEEEADTEQTKFKNIEYKNDMRAFTAYDEKGNPEKGFLYIFNKYKKDSVDLFLEQDLEQNLFDMLDSDSRTKEKTDIIKFLLYVYDGVDRGVSNYDKIFRFIDIYVINKNGISAFGCTITREQFIEKALEKGESVLSGLAGEFYDICTSPEYNVNPCLAYAWAAKESTYGKHAPYNNLFGMNIGNGMSSGNKYDTYGDSIKAFCEWVIEHSNPETGEYKWACTRAGEFSQVNECFIGTPSNNIYVLFCGYAYLGNTHYIDEKDYHESESERYAYYERSYDERAGRDISSWGQGGRISIYYMYEHGLYEGEYEIRCTHKYGTDETTLQEKADYAQFEVEKRIQMAKDIFGDNCFSRGKGVFPEYQQSDLPWGTLTYGGPRGLPHYTGNNGQRKTIGTSGCGCAALANILSGYTGQAITPDVLLGVLDNRYPGGQYYSPGKGSNAGILCGVLDEFGCTYLYTRDRNQALEALKNGYAVLGGEEGHFLAFVPVTSEEAEEGYVFRILDSGRGHGGLYRSWEEADSIVKGSCVVTHIIYPPEYKKR